MKTSRVVILASVLASTVGCSSTDDFVGTWKYTSGSMNVICGSDTLPPITLSGNITINEGSSSDLILVDEECSIKLTIDGDKATLDGSQTCVAQGGDSLTYSAHTFTVDDTTARLSANGSARVQGVDCTFSGSGDLEKL
jgi:hypothetical protein